MHKLIALTLALFATTALAAGKVGVVDMEQALFLSNAAKSSIKEFEKDNKEEVNKLKKLQEEIISLREKVEKEAEQKWRQRFLQEQLPGLEKELKAIIDKEKYDVVLQAGAVIYRTPTVDLTKQLIERLNDKK